MFPVIFVSLGPGEPELITVKGLKALQTADCIFCPETPVRDGQSFTRSRHPIATRHSGKHGVPLSTAHEQTARKSPERLRRGLYGELHPPATRKEGLLSLPKDDAGFYSSIHYVYDKLQADGIPVKHIPGIPAFIAAGALGGLHMASQEERLTVIPGITTTEEIEKLTSENSAVVVMKLSRCTDEIHRCIRLHPEYRYHYFENVGTPEEKYINDSKRIATIRFPYFSLLIIRTETF